MSGVECDTYKSLRCDSFARKISFTRDGVGLQLPVKFNFTLFKEIMAFEARAFFIRFITDAGNRIKNEKGGYNVTGH